MVITTSETSCGIWDNWISYATTSGTMTATNTTWSYWTSAGTTITSTNNYIPQAHSEEYKKKQAEYELRIAEVQRKEKIKEEKARQLLSEVLTEEQDAQFTKDGYFELVSIKSGNKYRIYKGRSRNVTLLKADGTPEKKLCFHPKDWVHDYDTLVAQKLMLELYEDDVKKVANYS